jgi:hypothetical protein
MCIEYFINVEDCARLHVLATIHLNVENQRLFGFAEPYNWNDVLGILRKLYPKKRFPEDIPGLGSDLSKIILAVKAKSLLKEFGRPGWTGLEQSIKENTEDLTKSDDY